MKEKTVPGALLTLKGVEIKVRALVEELEKEVEGIQIAVVIAIPDKEDKDMYACTAYLNMDSPLLANALQKNLSKPIDKLPRIS